MGGERLFQLGQFGLGVAVVQVEGEMDEDFVEIVDDEMQARLDLNQWVIGIVRAELRLEAIEVGDEVELDVTEKCEHQ